MSRYGNTGCVPLDETVRARFGGSGRYWPVVIHVDPPLLPDGTVDVRELCRGWDDGYNAQLGTNTGSTIAARVGSENGSGAGDAEDVPTPGQHPPVKGST